MTINELNGTYILDASHSAFSFVTRHAMVTKVRGSFTDFSGSLTLDGANPAASGAQVTVQMASVDSGTADRDAHLKSPDFFNVEAFPTMTFTSTAVKQDGEEFVLIGDLTIKDVTRPVEIEVELDGIVTDPWGNTRAGFAGETEISRKDFGLTWNKAQAAGGVLVGDKVTLELEVSAVKA